MILVVGKTIPVRIRGIAGEVDGVRWIRHNEVDGAILKP